MANYFRKVIPALTEDTVYNGNAAFSQWSNVGELTLNGVSQGNKGGAYSLSLTGNVRGVRINGIKQDSFTITHFNPTKDDLAKKKAVKGALGSDGLAALKQLHTIVNADPNITWTSCKTQFAAWADANDNAAYSEGLLLKLKSLLGISTWAAAKSFLTSKQWDDSTMWPVDHEEIV